MGEKDKETGKEQKGIDPAKFFNETEYNTIKMGRNTEAGKNKDATRELLDLLDSKVTGEKDNALDLLKKEKAVDLLINAIKDCKNPKDKAMLIAACWETGMDFKTHLDFFAELVHDDDLFVSMEAITVIDENAGEIDKSRAEKLIASLEKASEDHFNAAQIQDVIGKLKAAE